MPKKIGEQLNLLFILFLSANNTIVYHSQHLGKTVGYSAESQLVKPSFCPLLLSMCIYTVFQNSLSINMSLRVHS